jgi:hypothetical protein
VNTIKNKNDYKSWTWGGGELVLGLSGFKFLKNIGHLQSFCVILGGWVFIKSEKGNKWGVFVVWCWDCFGAILFMEHWQKLCLVLDKWVVPSSKETDPKSEEKLNNVSKPKCVSIDYHQVVLTKKRKSDTFIELVIPASLIFSGSQKSFKIFIFDTKFVSENSK